MSEIKELKTIDIPDSNIHYTLPELKYDLSEIKQKAKEIQLSFENVEVTEETIGTNKKLVAELNKAAGRLNDEKILVKREIMLPYTVLEMEIKEIIEIIKDTDDVIRSQIKDLTEKERDAKEVEILEMFGDRSTGYGHLKSIMNFNDFLDPKMLNKTMSLKKIEQYMIDYFEHLENDLLIIKNLPDRDNVLKLYLEVKDVAKAISMNAANKEREAQVKEIVQDTKPNKTKAVLKDYTFSVTGDTDFRIVQELLNQNNISYKLV